MEENKVLVFAAPATSRVSYIVSTLFPAAELTDSKEKFTAYLGVKICYADTKFCTNNLWIVPDGLLNEKEIRPQNTTCSEWNGKKTFFATNGDLPFDLFSAAFYLLSRYEEYLAYEPDGYGRYAHTNSIAYINDFLKTPLVNEWLQLVERELRERCSNARFRLPQTRFSFVPTYDVDEAFSYRHKPLWKNVLGFYRDLLLGKFEQVVERGNVYSGRKPDPYDVFEWMDGLHDTYKLQPIYFFLTIIKPGKYDKNLLASSNALRELYGGLSQKYRFGLHPSWQSGTEETLLLEEKRTLEEITGSVVENSRNHYLRFTIPHTYRRLIESGIKHEYSMAYGNVNGFRASYALPFRWYDLEKETTTDLVVHPFCFMEATSVFNQGFSVEQTEEEIQYYHDTVKKVNGEFITLFHNHFLTEQPQWVQWREMYKRFLERNFGG